MTSGIVLAGGAAKDTPSLALARWYYEKVYGETYYWGKYKPLKKVKIKQDGKIIKQPMVDLVIKNLSKAKSIDEIIVVGEEERLNKMLDLTNYSVPVKFVQQVGAIAENILEAYHHSKSGKKNKNALFVPCDIPKAMPNDYDTFIRACSNYTADLYYAVIGKESINGKSKMFNRPYFWAVDDVFNTTNPYLEKQGFFNKTIDLFVNGLAVMTGNTEFYQNSKSLTRGFRPSNIGFGNPRKVKKFENLNYIYRVRKAKEIFTVLSIFKEAIPETIDYSRGRLKVSQINNTFSNFIGGDVKMVEVFSSATSLDIDSKEDSDDKYWTR